MIFSRTGDSVSGSRIARQYVVPDLLIHYQQTQSLDAFDRWLYDSHNLMQTTADLTDVEYDGRTLFNKGKSRLTCGRGPSTLPQKRQIVGIVGGSEAIPNSWPFMVSE